MNYPEFFRRASDRIRSAAPWRRVPRWTQPLLYVGVVAGMLSLGIVFGSWTRACAGGACPSIAVLDTYRPQQALKVYAADGRLIQELGVEHRTVVGAVGQVDHVDDFLGPVLAHHRIHALDLSKSLKIMISL